MIRSALFLLAGLALGYLLFRENAAPPRGERPAVVVAPAPPATTAPRERPATTDAPPSPAPVPDRTAVAPRADLPADAEVEPGLGRIEIEFVESNDLPEVYLEVMTIEGRRESLDFNAETGRAWLDVRPGEHVPYWELPDRLGRWGVRVRVESGRVTHIRADDAPLFELRGPDGVGQLDVTVRSATGFPLANLELYLRGSGEAGSEWLEGHTNRTGRVRFEALPGGYTVEIGARAMPVEIRAGERIEVDLRPEAEGEMHFDMPAGSPRPRIVFSGTGESSGEGVWWAGLVDGVLHQGFFFVRPGTCEVRLQGLGAATMGVGARQVTRFEGPPGGIRATLAGASPHENLRLVVERLGDEGWTTVGGVDELAYAGAEDGDDRVRCVPFLRPGTYRVHGQQHFPAGGHWETERSLVEVGDGWTDVRLRFMPGR